MADRYFGNDTKQQCDTMSSYNPVCLAIWFTVQRKQTQIQHYAEALAITPNYTDTLQRLVCLWGNVQFQYAQS